MKLGTKKWFGNMENAFVRLIIIVIEPFPPILRQRVRIQRISVILYRNITAFGPGFSTRLILASMSISQVSQGPSEYYLCFRKNPLRRLPSEMVRPSAPSRIWRYARTDPWRQLPWISFNFRLSVEREIPSLRAVWLLFPPQSLRADSMWRRVISFRGRISPV